MRAILMLSFAFTVGVVSAWGEVTPAQAKPGAAPAKPNPGAAQKPAPQAPRRAAQPAARSGIAMTVVDPNGATIPDVAIAMTGPVDRDGVTDASGQLNFPGLQAGTYRLRFSGDSFVIFEREVTLRAGQVEKLSIRLNPAPVAPAPLPPPAPPQPEEAPAPAPPQVGPEGEPQVLSLVDLVEADLIEGDEPRKDTLVACSGNTRSMLVQLNQPQAKRVYDEAEALYYVIAGEGVINVDGRDVVLEAGRYAALPRGVGHTITRKGRRPLIMLAVLSGAPCEVAK